eukprot:TRINITY_DN28106_c0_g1_i1.p1 TRINITY_DN28106_c0_g1~~TRINITY_DN28106_c0_g1_i1.p1  ORF type:complete len:513 (-),score=46.98 TRINITY_DN28106_c0_g1_i1:347-1855(-)
MSLGLKDLDANCLALTVACLGQGLRPVNRCVCDISKRQRDVIFSPSLDSIHDLADELGLDARSSKFFLQRVHHQIWDATRQRMLATVKTRLPSAEFVPPCFVWRNALPEPNTPFSGMPVLHPRGLVDLLSYTPLIQAATSLRLEFCVAASISSSLPSLRLWDRLQSLELVACHIDDNFWFEASSVLPRLLRFAFFGSKCTQLPIQSGEALSFGDELRELSLSPTSAGIPKGVWEHLFLSATRLCVLHINALDTRSIAKAIFSSKSIPALRFLSLSPQREHALALSEVQKSGLLQDRDLELLIPAVAPTLQVFLLIGQQSLTAAALKCLSKCSRVEVLGLRGCAGLCHDSAAQTLHVELAEPHVSLHTIEVPCAASYAALAKAWPLVRFICTDANSDIQSCNSVVKSELGLVVQAGTPIWKSTSDEVDIGALEPARVVRFRPRRNGARGWAGGTPSWVQATIHDGSSASRFCKDEAQQVLAWCRERRSCSDDANGSTSVTLKE